MNSLWYLEGILGHRHDTVIVPIQKFPFYIGREQSCDLTVASKETSRIHAIITLDEGGGLLLHDQNSTNGSFVNRHRIFKPTPLHDGDILHFGAVEFRLRKEQRVRPVIDPEFTLMKTLAQPEFELPQQFVLCEKEFLQLLDQEAIQALFQPIARFSDQAILAYEVLGRGNHPKLPENPAQLFAIAHLLDKEIELSQKFRLAGIKACLKLAPPPLLFLNTHPREMFSQALYHSLEDIKQLAPDLPLVLEINEKAITEIDKMKTMAKQLKAMDIQLAYDDFGAGQARLLELVEVTPDFLKFDFTLVHNIHLASLNKQNLVRTLVDISNHLGIVTLAEGIESQEEGVVCQQMGFKLVQGYYYGRPEPIEHYLYLK